MSRITRALLLAGALALLVPASAAAAARPSSRSGASTAPIYVTAPPRDTSRLFVVERGGRDPGGRRAARGSARRSSTSPATSTRRASAACSRSPSRPTTRPPGCSTSTWSRASRRARSRSASTSARPRTPTAPTRPGGSSAGRRTTRSRNHNGGQLEFGPDGYLWFATGDGGGGNDVHNHARDLSSPLGKVLRIDPRPRQRGRATGSRRATRSAPRSGPTACATRSASRSTAGRATCDRRRRPGRARGDRLRARRAAAWAAAATTAGRAARARSPGRRPARSARPTSAPVFDYASDGRRRTRSPAATSCATPGCRRCAGRYVYADAYDGAGALASRPPRRGRPTPRHEPRRAQHARLVRRGRVRARLRGVDRPRQRRADPGRRAGRLRAQAGAAGAAPAGRHGGERWSGRVRPHRPARADPGRGQGPRRPPRAAADRAHRERGLPRDHPRPPRRLDAGARPHARSAAAAARSSASARRRRPSSASAARSAATSASRCACR